MNSMSVDGGIHSQFMQMVMATKNLCMAAIHDSSLLTRTQQCVRLSWAAVCNSTTLSRWPRVLTCHGSPPGGTQVMSTRVNLLNFGRTRPPRTILGITHHPLNGFSSFKFYEVHEFVMHHFGMFHR
jgi:hypothetical protein